MRGGLLSLAVLLFASTLPARPLESAFSFGAEQPPPTATAAETEERCVYSAPRTIAPSADALALAVGGERPPTLEQTFSRTLSPLPPADAPADWLSTTPLLAGLPGPPGGYMNPLDLVLQYRIPPDFCPEYLPEQNPALNNAQLCGPHLLTDWQLEQGVGRVNPFRVAAAEARALSEDREERDHKLAWLAAYSWLHRGEREWGLGAADLLLSETRYGQRDVLLTALVPPLLRRIPPALTAVTPAEGEIAIDLRITPEFAYDSVATDEQVLLTAAARGLGAVVIAGRGQIGDAQAAVRLAERLKAEGRLPPDFRVIIGQYVTSRTGAVVALFLRDRLLEGQTMAETVEEIHRQGGLAYMAHPGDIGAAASLDRLPFDGYLIQPGNFELFRTLLLLNDPRFADKPALYASNSTAAATVGLPYSSVKPVPSAPDPIRAGLAARQGYAAGTLYFPWMMLLLTKPIAIYQKTLNRFFQFNDELVIRAGRLIGADNVILRTTWDDEMRDMISLSHSLPSWHRLISGGSPLRQLPRLAYIEAEFGWWSVGYNRELDEWLLISRRRW